MSSRDFVRWGILGVAKINERLLPGFAAARNSQLVAIASRSLVKARSAAESANIPHYYGSYEQLLADSEIDAVYVPLPNHLHAEWTKKAADSGKHVLCEKPLTPHADEAATLVEYCDSKNVRLMDGFMWPHHPRTAALRQLIDSDRIGRVERVDGAFTFPLELDPANIRLKSDAGGGSLLDVGCYPVYGIRWAFAAEPVRAFAMARFEFDVDLAMSAMLLFADGRMASFDCGFTLPLRQQLQITGSKGVVTVPNMWVPEPAASYELRIGDSVQHFSEPGHDQIACMIDDFGRAVLNGHDPVPHPREAVGTLKVLDALVRSAREGRPIDVA